MSDNVLTVARLISDLQSCKQDSEAVVVVYGMGVTIPIKGIMQVDANGKALTVLTVARENVETAMGYNYDPDIEN